MSALVQYAIPPTGRDRLRILQPTRLQVRNIFQSAARAQSLLKAVYTRTLRLKAWI